MFSLDDVLSLSPDGLADLSLFHGHWPFHRLPALDAEVWRGYLNEWKVRPLVTPLSGVFYKDPTAALPDSDAQLASLGIKPWWAPVINPALDGWEGDLERYARSDRVVGVRLVPGYQGCTIDEPRCVQCMKAVTEGGLVCFIQCRLEDERIQHAVFPVKPVAVEALAKALGAVEGSRSVVCGLLYNEADKLMSLGSGAGRLLVEMSYFKGPDDALKNWEDAHGIATIAYGSMWPLLVPEAAIYRILMSQASAEAKRSVFYGNAARLMPEVYGETD